MANTKVPVELSSTPSIVDNGNATAITIDSSENSTFSGNINLDLATPSVIFKESGAAKFFIGESSAVGGGSGYYDLYAAGGLGQRFFTGAAERMRIESDGDVTIGDGASNIDIGIGNTGTVGHLGRTGSGALIHLGGDDCQVRLANSIIHHDNSGNTNLYLRNHYTTLGNDNTAKVTLESGTLVFATSTAYTERMRIDSSGNLLVGTTTALSSSNSGGACFLGLTQGRKQLQLGHTSSSSLAVAQFFGNSSTVTAGSITCNASATAYNTSSDYRLKENVDYDFTALDRVAQLKPARFNFIEDADITVDGFLAHEVQDIVPEAVTGEKNAVKEEEYEVTPAVLDDDGNVVTEAEMGTREVPDYQGIDQSKLVPLLTKAIQEQQELINNLTARIEQLEN